MANLNDEMLDEIDDFVARNSELVKYFDTFRDAAMERCDSFIYRMSQACRYFGVSSLQDPKFNVIHQEVESLYPTYEQMKGDITGGKEVKFPSYKQFKTKLKELDRKMRSFD